MERRAQFFSRCSAAAALSTPWVPSGSMRGSATFELGDTISSFANVSSAPFYTGTMLVLASQSPRRSEILRQAGIPSLVRVAPVDETPLGGETPDDYVRRLAESEGAGRGCRTGETVLGADTTVVIDGEMLGKPDRCRRRTPHAGDCSPAAGTRR